MYCICRLGTMKQTKEEWRWNCFTWKNQKSTSCCPGENGIPIRAITEKFSCCAAAGDSPAQLPWGAMGALRTGAGLVYLAVPESIYAIEAVKLTEPVVLPLPDEAGMLSEQAIPKIRELLPKMDAVLFGCGSGLGKGPEKVLEFLIREFQKPLILDADGITLLSRNIDLLRGRTGPLILTPHDGEFQRLKPMEGDRLTQTMEMAKNLGAVILRKGYRSLITDGQVCWENCTGNPGMAVGGSGDVLAGIIVSLLGQGIAPLEAAACGAWLHGRAGDLCAQELGEYGMLPTDLLERLPRLLK